MLTNRPFSLFFNFEYLSYLPVTNFKQGAKARGTGEHCPLLFQKGEVQKLSFLQFIEFGGSGSEKSAKIFLPNLTAFILL